jgi:hypothetical protein
MIGRFRRLGALLALTALSAFYAESVWAGACPPEAEHAGAAAQASDGNHHGHAGTAGMHHPVDVPEGSRPSSPEAPDCPMKFTGASGTCVAAPLASAGSHVHAPAEPEGSVGIVPDPARDRLCSTTLFHPPRS